MAQQIKSLSTITERAVRILIRELGWSDATRFLQKYSRGLGDYTRQRKKLLAGRTIDEIVHDIRKRKSTR